MGERIEAGIHARYVKTLQPLVAASEPLQGLQRIYSTGVVQQYARPYRWRHLVLRRSPTARRCVRQVASDRFSSRLEVEADSPRVAREGQSVRDGGTTVSVLRRKSTSTYEQDLVGRATEDVVYEVLYSTG